MILRLTFLFSFLIGLTFDLMFLESGYIHNRFISFNTINWLSDIISTLFIHLLVVFVYYFVSVTWWGIYLVEHRFSWLFLGRRKPVQLIEQSELLRDPVGLIGEHRIKFFSGRLAGPFLLGWPGRPITSSEWEFRDFCILWWIGCKGCLWRFSLNLKEEGRPCLVLSRLRFYLLLKFLRCAFWDFSWLQSMLISCLEMEENF